MLVSPALPVSDGSSCGDREGDLAACLAQYAEQHPESTFTLACDDADAAAAEAAAPRLGLRSLVIMAMGDYVLRRGAFRREAATEARSRGLSLFRVDPNRPPPLLLEWAGQFEAVRPRCRACE